ncbi:hypothetical protein O181_082515 [Austropuccinia psidii MF-1]|uniref:Uncharacterized protein n=1 Tax=Austropuccinia psidii MF-1 TaxID=1389203 RepID=A0A9Q3IKX6_9BASI|nr:hypothetical protein [Austropuccinia psidii MF-1]
MKQQLINVLYTYKNALDSDDKPLGSIRGHQFYITLTIDRSCPLVLRRPAYPASPSTWEALEEHIQQLRKLVVLRKVGNREEPQAITTVDIASKNDKLRMIGDFGELNIYTVPDRYPVPRTPETLINFIKQSI